MKRTLLAAFAFACTTAAAQTVVNITDADLQGNQTYSWTNNNIYLLDGLVFLETGGVLNIQEGTVIKFTPKSYSRKSISAYHFKRSKDQCDRHAFAAHHLYFGGR